MHHAGQEDVMTANERATQIAHKCFGGDWSRETFSVMVKDQGDTGKNLRKWIGVIEAEIEADRKAIQKAAAPS